tara:strand:+ start:3583 stop:4074 length:492 start_codon:yes stop_codon:yes gene_type:complete
MLKSRRNYSFAKAGNKIKSIIAETLTDMARYQNESLQRGIDTQTDIKGSKFAKLTTTTLLIRNKRKHGFLPLDTMKGVRQKKLRNTKINPARPNNLVSQVLMLTEHGVYHNEGFTTGSTSMIPNKKVPKREWFGITKEMQKNGTQYKKFVEMSLFKLARSLKK